MKTPVFAIRVLFFSCLWQMATFQTPVRNYYHHQNRSMTEFRLPRASLLLRYMNQSIDPCTDFYEFACGNWPKYHQPSEDTPITSPTEQLKEKVLADVQDLLKEKVTLLDGHFGRKVKDFYASCMDVEKASQTIRATFMNFIKFYEGMPAVEKRWNEHNYNWVTQLGRLKHKFGMDIIIGLQIKPDYQTTREGRIYIGEPSTLIPKHLCKFNTIDDAVNEELQQEVINNMAYWFDMGEVDARRLAVEIFDFELTLCRGMMPHIEALNKALPKRQLQELNGQFPGIDFHNFVTSSLGQPIHQTVYMENENYFVNLAKVMRITPKRVVANYVMYRALVTISFTDEADPVKRTRLCTEKTIFHFHRVVGELYHRKFFRDETLKDVEEIFTKLKDAFRHDVSQQTAIDETTRRHAVYKINDMHLRSPVYDKSALDGEYNTMRIEKRLFWENIQYLLELEQKRNIKKLHFDGNPVNWGPEIEAADIHLGYSAIQNIIRMPLAMLQPPIYHRTAPYAYKFGTLGFLIARELIHAFDMPGIHHNGLPRTWHDHDSQLFYNERAKCFKEQYENYLNKNADSLPPDMDDRIREAIIDNGALNTSFSAYLVWLQKTSELHMLYDETLSDVDYTNTQLFFIAFAQNYCTATYTPMEEEVTADPTLFPWDEPNRVEKFKVNGPMANMHEFAREFNCPPGAEMNPPDKCFIY